MEHIPEPESGIKTAMRDCKSGLMFCGASFVILIIVYGSGGGIGYYGPQTIFVGLVLFLLVIGLCWGCMDR